MRFAFVHIPKTGGTSLKNIFKQTGKVYHRDKNVRPQNFEDYDVCMGHFYPSIYEGYPIVTWLRNPIERVVSHYTHLTWKMKNQNINRIVVMPGGVQYTFEWGCDIVAFAEKVGNLYSVYTEGDIDKFAYIGLLGKMRSCLRDMRIIFNIRVPDEIPVMRKSMKHVSLTNAEKEKLRKILWDDFEIYKEVKSKHER